MSPIQGSAIVFTLQLTQQNSPPTLGLRLLRLTSEELCVARGLPSPRAKFLRKCFTDQVKGGNCLISIAHSQIPATLQLILLRLTQAIAEPNATTGTTLPYPHTATMMALTRQSRSLVLGCNVCSTCFPGSTCRGVLNKPAYIHDGSLSSCGIVTQDGLSLTQSCRMVNPDVLAALFAVSKAHCTDR